VPSPLEKARQAPDSTKARIFYTARQLFGEYGYHGVTARMIAQAVGIDVSTMYYHWGEKPDLYEAVLEDLDDQIRYKLKEIEKTVRGKDIGTRLAIAIDVMCDYLFAHPEAAKLLLQCYFSKTRTDDNFEDRLTEHIANIAVAMGLALDRKAVTPQANARVLAVWNAVINFTAGEHFLRPMLELKTLDYRSVVKETLRFILLPAFTGAERQAQKDSRG